MNRENPKLETMTTCVNIASTRIVCYLGAILAFTHISDHMSDPLHQVNASFHLHFYLLGLFTKSIEGDDLFPLMIAINWVVFSYTFCNLSAS